jgi:hypothetical protein
VTIAAAVALGWTPIVHTPLKPIDRPGDLFPSSLDLKAVNPKVFAFPSPSRGGGK